METSVRKTRTNLDIVAGDRRLELLRFGGNCGRQFPNLCAANETRNAADDKDAMLKIAPYILREPCIFRHLDAFKRERNCLRESEIIPTLRKQTWILTTRRPLYTSVPRY